MTPIPAVQLVKLVAPTTMTNTATTTANFDTMGADYATIIFNFGAELNTNAVGPTLSIQSSDDTVVTNFATIVANRTAEDLTSAKGVVYHVDMKARKRYLRLSVTTATATNDNVTFSAYGVLSRMAAMPASTTAMVGSTNDVVVVV